MADRKLTKSVGEHWTCSVLAGLGWAVALTRDGLARTDILGVHTSSGEMVEIQVKTASYSKPFRWVLGEKGCTPARTDREWYVLVGLNKDPRQSHRAWVVPRDHVAAATWLRHQEWLTSSAVPAGRRNTPVSNARVDDWVFARYEDRWDLLDGAASACPVLMPKMMHRWIDDPKIGLRNDHPWNDRRRIPEWLKD